MKQQMVQDKSVKQLGGPIQAAVGKEVFCLKIYVMDGKWVGG